MSDAPVGTVGRRMKYPYTVMGKFIHFPWKHYWKHGRGFRFTVYAIIATFPLIYPIHKFVNSPGNVAEWNRIREARKHDPFAPPTEHGHGKH